MQDQITIVSKTQMIVIEPNTKATTVVDAGPQGPLDPLAEGAPGANAKDAFQLAQQHGFVGTVVQWLASLDASPDDANEVPEAIGGIPVAEVPDTFDILGGIHVTELV